MGKWIRRFAALVMVMVLAANGVSVYLVSEYNGAGPLTESKTLVFARKQGFRAMVDTLEAEGVVSNALVVKMIAFAAGKAHRFKAGEYAFFPGISARQAVDMLVSGRVVVRKITIPEGLTSREVVAAINREPALDGMIEDRVPEGALLPETYHFMHGDERIAVLKQMQDAMTELLDRLWEQRRPGLPLASKTEALTLASIVEKETGVAGERPLVASVFINRLRKGMRLQSDPTVAYGLLEATGQPLGRSLTLDDLKSETPYNTYVIDRLPPGPIANPGRAALEAVLHPPDSDYLYFVATGSGGHHFARTLEDHNRNVQLYRQALKARQ